ncbi:MAG: hypothetical protein QM734_14010 [Cyclobacteriaceae bacterium]
MNFLKKLFGTKDIDGRLFGKWTTDKNDKLTVDFLGDVTMTFTPKGELIYEIKEGERLQIINMTFWTEDNYIISDQPSHPKKEKTKYSFGTDEYLILEFQGQTAKLIKVA